MSRSDDLEITDSHVHFFSRDFFRALLAARPGAEGSGEADVESAVGGLGLEVPPRDPVELARRWVAELDRHAVSRAVLIASVPGDWPSVVAAVRAFPRRFAGLAMANPLAPGAPDAVARALDEGLCGVCLFPAMHRFHVYEEAPLRVIERARERGAHIFVHFGVLRVPIREKLGLRDDFDGTRAVPTDLHRVAADFPDVTFRVPHFGCGYFRETLLLGAQRPNVVVDTAGSNSWTRLSPWPLDLRAVIAKTLEVFGPERVLWGSDSSVLPRGFRRDILDEQRRLFEDAGLSRDELALVFGGNTRRLLGID